MRSKKELLKRVARESQYPYAIVEDVLNALDTVCADAIAREGECRLWNLVNIHTKVISPYRGYDVSKKRVVERRGRKALYARISPKLLAEFKRLNVDMDDDYDVDDDINDEYDDYEPWDDDEEAL